VTNFETGQERHEEERAMLAADAAEERQRAIEEDQPEEFITDEIDVEQIDFEDRLFHTSPRKARAHMQDLTDAVNAADLEA
jgi:hypothetical protein